MTTGKPDIERVKRSKAFRASMQGMSRNGKFEVDEQAYDPLEWPIFPPVISAKTEAKALQVAHHFAYMAQRLGGVPEAEAAKAMLEIREDLFMHWPGHYLYFYMGPPRHRPLPVMVGVWQMTGERDEQLRMLAGYETEDLAEPPAMEAFSSEHLGFGVKVRCVQKGPRRRGSLVGLLGYAWRSEELQTDLHMRALCPDLGWLEGATPGIDRFARAARLVPKH
ncbi:MAG TPA: hypothetical protein VG142_14210 [Trebonia sp.]|nr:hypothetical protein [Trebonia sp.]